MRLPKHIPQLDVLRGLAVLAVILYHAGDFVPALRLHTLFGFGYLGVDLFFVLSGFLITGILVASKDEASYFTNFYARRILRIWPLYYALLLLTFVVLPLVRSSMAAPIFQQSHPWEPYLFFVQNFFGNVQRAFYMVRVTWSLAIEEQFYLVWPVIVWLAPRQVLKPLALGGIFLSIAARWSVQYGLIPPVNFFTNPLTRLDGLALGAFLSLWIPEAQDRTVRWGGVVALALVVPATIMLGRVRPGHCVLYAMIAACFAALLCASVAAPVLPRLAFLKYTGKVSYCLYLAHVPVFMAAGSLGFRHWCFPGSPRTSETIQFVVSLALCYVVAAASWRFYEGPFLRLKTHFESRRTATAGAPSVLALGERPGS